MGLPDQKAGGFAIPVELLIQNNPTNWMTRIIPVLLKGKVRIYQPRKLREIKERARKVCKE